jgi:hypothetical protein
MEAWRQWLSRSGENLVPANESKIDLTPTGLLIEGEYAQNPVPQNLERAEDKLVGAVSAIMKNSECYPPNLLSDSGIRCGPQAPSNTKNRVN